MQTWIGQIEMGILPSMPLNDFWLTLGAMLCMLFMALSAWGVVHSLNNIIVIIVHRFFPRDFPADIEGVSGGSFS